MSSIFPDVTVEILRPLQIGPKPIPTMTVGLIGPVFKQRTETKVNGYAIEPETAASISINLSAVLDGEYIDYDSMQVHLKSNATDLTTTLNDRDSEVIGVDTVIKSGIDVDNSSYGYFKEVTNRDIAGNAYIAISAATHSAGIVTVTTGTEAHGFLPGDIVTISTTVGMTDLNSTFAILETPTAVTFTVELKTAQTYSSGGQAVVKRWVFYPSTGSTVGLGAAPGDILYKYEDGTLAGDVRDVIRKTIPTKLSATMDAPTAHDGTNDYFTFPGTTDISDFAANQYLIAILKNDRSVVYQYRIKTIDITGDNDILYWDDITSDAPITSDWSNYDWYVYDMPFGGMLVWRENGASEPANTTDTYKYSILDYNMRITDDSTSDKKGVGLNGLFGRFVNPYQDDYVFLPNKRSNMFWGDTKIGDYLEATNIYNSAQSYQFRILKAGSSVLKGFINAPSAWTTGSPAKFTFPAGTTISSSEFVTEKSYLIATNKTDGRMRIYRLVDDGASNGAWDSVNRYLYISNTNFSFDGSGEGNNYVKGNWSDWNWSIWDMPPSAVKVAVTDATGFTNASGNNSDTYDFRIVNTADFYVSGREEVTILNHISDENNEEIGLADVIFTYNVLDTSTSGNMYDITTQERRVAYCGAIANYNPLGLGAAMVELNTTQSYKVFPLDIAFEERDPDNPKAYSGKYMPGETNTNYHNVSNLDWTGAKTLLSKVRDTQIPYYLVPLTNDSSVHAMFANALTEFAKPEKKKEMLLFATTTLPTEDVLLSNINVVSNDFTIVDGKLRYRPTTKYVDSDNPSTSVDFLSIGAKKGDYISYIDDGTGEEILIQIVNIYPSYFDLGTTTYASVGALVATIDAGERISIKKVYSNKADIVAALVAKAAGFNSFRVKLIWPDYVDLNINGTTFTSVLGCYAAAGYAAMAVEVGTVVPKTQRTIAGVSNVYNVTPYFEDTELEDLGAGYLDIFSQDFDGGPVYSKRQFMTDASELSGVEPVDEYAKYLRRIFKPLVGPNNITASLFDVLSVALSAAHEEFVTSRFQSITLIKGLQVSGPNKDRVSLREKPNTFKPFNGLDIQLEL